MDAHARFRHALPIGLALAIVLVYAPSLGAGWLELDDDWLIRDDPFLAHPTLSGLAAMWGDLSRATRLVLGAEYLPIRDTSEWIVASIAGVRPDVHRAIDLAIYVGACLALRAWLLAAIPARPWAAELAACLFAVHPVHAESVAWMAGRKDVLALLFVAVALRAYASPSPRARRIAVPIACALAMLSKASAVVLPLLLVVHDALARRRLDPIAIGSAAIVAGLVLILHLRVGAIVGMLAPLPGGSRLAALATMGPVVLRYLGLALGVLPGSIEHDVPERSPGDPIAIAAWLAILALVALAIAAWRRGERAPAIALALFAVPLLPVSQVLAPLQNRMADRYLLLAVLGPCYLAGEAVARLPSRAAFAASAALIVALGGLGIARAATFADPVAVWVEASERAPASPLGPYQLGMAVRERDPAAAEAAFGEAIRRDGLTTDTGRRASNNLAILLAGQGRLPEAIALLEPAVAAYPHDPRVRSNLARLYDAVGRTEEAAALRAELARRFPTFRPGASQ